MSNLLTRYNEKQKQKAIIANTDSRDVFGRYKAIKEENGTLEVLFASGDNEGNLQALDTNGVWLVLPIKEIQLIDMSYSSRDRKRYVGIRTLEVAVGDIDEENKTVYLKNGRINADIVRRFKGELFDEAEKIISTRGTQEYQPYSIYGTIRKVDRDRENAFVELLGVPGLIGVIHISQWAKTRTVIIPEDAEYKGTPMEFHLTGIVKVNGTNYFRLSRKDIYDPMQDMPEEFFQKGNTIMVECTAIPANKDYWIGKIQNYPVEIRGNYTDRYGKGIIAPGRSFVCTVRKGDKDNGYIYANPYRYIMTNEEREQARQNGKIAITKEDLNRLEQQKRQELLEQQEKEAGIKPE